DQTGPLLPAAHLFTVVAASAVLLLCLAAGMRIVARAGLAPRSSLEALPVAATVGIAAAGTALLLLGAVGGLRPWVLGPAPGALPGDRRAAVPPRALRSLLVIPGLAGCVLLTAAAVAPPADWDELMYHLAVPEQFVREGRVHLPADNLHVNLVGPVHLLYVPL